MDGRCGYRYVDKRDIGVKSRFFGLIDEEPNLKGVPAAIRRRLPRFARFTLASAREAVAMAFGDASPTDYHDPFDCGVIIGTGWGGLDEVHSAQIKYIQKNVGSPFGCFESMHSVGTAACSMFWSLRGVQNTPIAACATGTMAIGDAFEFIRNRKATFMLAGGGESLCDDASIWNIDVLGALSTEEHEAEKASCPFSLGRSGFVLSEGAAVLCLESLDSALARGATIYGEIKGYANYSDAWDFTAPAPDKLARIKCIEQALQQAQLAPQQLDYINAHGTSTQLNDVNETEVIKTVLGAAAKETPISSTKALSGHLIAAAGSFETMVCLQAIHHSIIPATCHYHTPDPECDLDYVPNHNRQAELDNVLNINFGFGGTNAALVIGRYPS
jgi:3-oxoacyl-[acyl-carrier-protein] synthase II